MNDRNNNFRAPAGHEPSNGELMRTIERLERNFNATCDAQNVTLREIRSEVKHTNGQVIQHGVRLTNVEKEVFRDKSGTSIPVALPASMAATAAAPEPKHTVNIGFTPDRNAVLAALGAAASVGALILREWLKRP